MTDPALPAGSDGRDDAAWIGRAFLIHLSLDASPTSGRLCGRIQHVRSSDATHFTSLSELVEFMGRYLPEGHE